MNENANKDSKVFNTQRDLTAGTVWEGIGLEECFRRTYCHI